MGGITIQYDNRLSEGNFIMIEKQNATHDHDSESTKLDPSELRAAARTRHSLRPLF
jgi:hypothetical protein